MKKTFPLLIIFIVISSVSFAHPGRTDSNGGHYDRSTGEYHYHDGSSLGSYSSGTLTIQEHPLYDKWKAEEYDKLKEQVNKYKEELEKSGFNTIEDMRKELNGKKSEISNLWIGFTFIFIIGVLMAYNIGVYKNTEIRK